MADDDINVMQAQLGLVGGTAPSFGIPTPMPQVRHPGEVSQSIVQQTQTASFQTMQATMMSRPGALGGYSMGALGSPIGDYNRMFQQNMASMNSQMFNPYVAQTMAGMGGYGGFTPGMLPSPIHMTPPSMGIFRPMPQGPMPSIPPTPHMPLVPMPWSARPVSPHFNTPFDYSWQIQQQRAMQHEAGFLATPGVAARAGVDAGFALGGAGLAANLGARLGGIRGAGIGGAIGAIGGLALAEYGGFGSAAQNVVNRLNPFRLMGLRAAQLRGMSPDFVVGGGELSPDGRGLSSTGARHLARNIEDLGWDTGFRRQTGNMFNTQDLTRITQQAGQQGLLDMTQGSDDIARQIKGVAKTVRTLMRIMGEPDVKEAVKQLGQMYHMGFSLPDMERALQSAKMYARMAGTSVKGIFEAGLAGAATFQSQGLTAGLGLEVGMGAMGMARQAVAGGTYTPQQLAMLGGVSGIAQREMMTHAATLKLPMMAAAMSNYGSGGTFGLNAGAAQGLMNGRFDIHQLTTMGANNLLDAVNKGGVGALGMFQVQQRELQDQLGRAMGPMGMKVMTLNQVMNTRKLMGLDKNAGGLVTAAMAMGMDEDQARQMLQEANSPEYFRNMQRQLEVQRNEIRARERERREETDPGALERWTRRGWVGSGAVYGARSFARGARNAMEGLGNAFAEGTEDRAAWDKNRQVVVRTHQGLLASNARQARRIRSIDLDTYNSVLRGVTDDDGTAGFMFGGRELGRTPALRWMSDLTGGDSMNLAQYREGEGGLESIFGGGNFERLARLTSGGNGWVSADDMRQGLRTRAGSAATLKEGLALSDTERAGMQQRLTAALGGDSARAGRFRAEYTKRLAEVTKNKTKFFGSTKAMEGEETRIAEELAKEYGLDLSKFGTQDIAKLGAKQAEALSLLGGGKGMRLQDGVDMRSAKIIRNNLEETFDKVSVDLFGDDGSWTQESKRREVLEKLSSASSSKVAAMAAYYAAERPEDAAKIKALIKDPGEAEAAESEALSLAQVISDEGSKDILLQMAQQLSSKKSPEEQNEWVKGNVDKYLARKGTVQYVDGLEKMLQKDPSLLEGSLETGAVMQRLVANRGKLTGTARKLADQWRGAKTAKERKAIEQQLFLAGHDRGAVSGTNVRGGDAFAAEAPVDVQQGALAATQGALAEHFPASVKTFEDSSRRMLEAANTILKAYAGTTLPVDINHERN